MIILTLRTDRPVSEIGLYRDKDRIDYIEWEAHRQLAETLHSRIDRVLKSNNLTLSDIGGLVAYKGPGSFTGLRIGISAVNALAYAYSLPIVSATGDVWISVGVNKLISGDSERVIVPEYGAPPNITQQKK